MSSAQLSTWQNPSFSSWDISVTLREDAVMNAAVPSPFFMDRVVSWLSAHAWLPSRFSRVWLFLTLWTVAHQFPLSVGFCRQEYWSGLPCLSPGDLPNPGIKHLQISYIAGRFFIHWATTEAHEYWSGQPIPSPGDHPNPGIEAGSPELQVDSLSVELPGKTW